MKMLASRAIRLARRRNRRSRSTTSCLAPLGDAGMGRWSLAALELTAYETWAFAAPILTCLGPPPAPYRRPLSREPPAPLAELRFDSSKKPSLLSLLYILSQSKALRPQGRFWG